MTREELITTITALLANAAEKKTTPSKQTAPSDTVEMLTIKECCLAVKGLNEYTVRQLVARNALPYIRCGQGKRGKNTHIQSRAAYIFQRREGVTMDEIFKLLNPDNTVTLNRPLAHILGANAAIIYSTLVAKQAYYSKRDMLDAEGYFYSTIDDLKESTSLSKRQQGGAIKTLVEVGLVYCKKRGMLARRCFRLCEDIALLNKLIESGKSATVKRTFPPSTEQNAPTSGNKSVQQVGAKCDDKSEQNEPYTYNLKKKTKVDNPNQSIFPDQMDMMDFPPKGYSPEERESYLELIKENIEYDYQTEKEKINEIVEIMLDVICSTKDTIRVNGEDMPREVVKSRFLKLDISHIDYVLTSLKKNTSEVRNIRAYLITALYNASTTIDSYYTAWVNHDMYGKS